MKINLNLNWIYIVVQLVLFILKLSGIITWSYWVVFIPTYIFIALSAIALIIAIIILFKKQKGEILMKREEIVNKLNSYAKEKTQDAGVFYCKEVNSIVLTYKGIQTAVFDNCDYNNFQVTQDVTNDKFPGYSFIEDESKTGLLYWFYSTGTRFLKKFKNKKYRIKVLKGNSEVTLNSAYLNISEFTGALMFSTYKNNDNLKSSFTKKEIEELKKRDDIAIDWDKAELEEVDDE